MTAASAFESIHHQTIRLLSKKLTKEENQDLIIFSLKHSENADLIKKIILHITNENEANLLKIVNRLFDTGYKKLSGKRLLDLIFDGKLWMLVADPSRCILDEWTPGSFTRVWEQYMREEPHIDEEENEQLPRGSICLPCYKAQFRKCNSKIVIEDGKAKVDDGTTENGISTDQEHPATAAGMEYSSDNEAANTVTKKRVKRKKSAVEKKKIASVHGEMLNNDDDAAVAATDNCPITEKPAKKRKIDNKKRPINVCLPVDNARIIDGDDCIVAKKKRPYKKRVVKEEANTSDKIKENKEILGEEQTDECEIVYDTKKVVNLN